MSVLPALAMLVRIANYFRVRLSERASAVPDWRPLPPILRDGPARAEIRLLRVLSWLEALTDIFSGGHLYHRPAREEPSGIPRSPATTYCRPPLEPHQREAARAAGRLAYKRKIFRY